MGKLSQFIKSFLSTKSSFSFIDERDIVTSLNRNWNNSDFLKAYQISLYVNRCIAKRAEKVGQIEFKLFRGDTEVENNEYLDLLYKPNEYMTGSEFWSMYQKYKDIIGTVYVWMEPKNRIFSKNSVPAALHLLRPDWVSKKISKEDGSLTVYEFARPDGQTFEFPADQIIEDKYPDPFNPTEGESILRSGIRAIDTSVQLDDYHASVLRNGGKIDGVFSTKEKLSPEQLNGLKRDYGDKYAEARESGKPLFLSGGLEYQRVSLSPEELSYLESKNVSLNDILLMTGVPKAVLGVTDDVKFDNAEASFRIFLSETIKPLLKSLTVKLDLKLIPEDMDLTFVDPTPVDVERQLKKLETANTINAMTINEKREALDLDPVDNGDVILVPFSVTPLEDAGAQGQQDEQPQENQKSIKQFHHPFRDSYTRRKYHELYIKRFDKRERQLMKELRKYFDEQKERVIAKLQPEVNRVFRRKNLIDDIFDQQIEIDLAKTAVFGLLEEYLLKSGQQSLDFIGYEYNFVLSSEIKIWLDKKVDVFATSINQTTFKKLQKEFERSLATGESRQELVKRIENTYGSISKSRAETIARTEVQGVTQKGSFEAYAQAQIPIKIWVSVLDSNTRDSHAGIDGEERPINVPFSNGLMYPGDPSGSAGEVINCRCTI